VALVGTAVVAAAPYDSQGFPNTADGAAFVFPKQGGTWPSSSPTELQGIATGDNFGYSGLTAIGSHIVAIGSPDEPNGGLYFFKK
jgi:hypothetical protein